MPIPPDTAFRHRALLYHSPEELVGTVVPMLRSSVDAGDAVLVVSREAALDAVRSRLTAGEARAVGFQRSRERYPTPVAALTSFQRLLARYAAEGRRALVVSEQPLAGLAPREVAELCRVDAAINEANRARGATVVCTYDLASAPPEAVAMARRSHPELLEGGRCKVNPAYTNATMLLAEQQATQELPEPPGDAALLSCPRDAAEARQFVAVAAGGLGLVEPALGRLVTAANEVVTNAMVHAVLDSLRVWPEDGLVVCEVRDYGFGLADPLAGYREPDPEGVSGRGLWLARQLADVVEVRSELGGCTVRLYVGLPPGQGGAGPR